MNPVLALLNNRQERPTSWFIYLCYLLVLILVIMYPAFASRFLLSNIVLFFLFVPMSLGLCLLWGRCGVLSFGQVAFFGIAGYIYGIVTINLGDAPGATVLGFLAGLAVSAIVAGLFGYFVFYGQVSGWIIPILTLALTLILELFLGQTAGYQWRVGQALLGGFNGINNIASLRIGPIDFDGGTVSLYYLVVLGSVVLFALLRMLVNSRWGVVIVAIREDIERTRLLGHNANLIQVVVFVVAALLAALSGLMYVWWGNYIDPSAMGMMAAILPVVYTTVGGKEGLLAVMISTVFLGYLGDFLSVYGGQYALMVNGVLLLFVILFYPRGIFLTVGERIESWLVNRTASRSGEAAAVGLSSESSVPPSLVSTSLAVAPTTHLAAAAETAPILEIKNLSKAFGGIKAVDDVSLVVRQGELRCLIGPNGAGKSTLFNLVIGQLLPSAGSVHFQGDEITVLPSYRRVRHGISMKFQITRVYNALSVSENLKIAWRQGNGLGGSDAGRWAFSMFGLDRHANRLAGSLTHVEKQWLEICLALATNPSLLLLDEPTVGMTLEETQQTAGFVRRLNESGLTILVIEHDMEFVREIGKQVTVLHQGRVFAEGSLDWIEGHEGVRKIYLGER